MDGISLLPLFARKMSARNRPIGFQSGGQVAWIEDRYKLYGNGKKPLKLFDLTADSAERTDLAVEHPEIVQRMVTALKEWQASCKRSDGGSDYSK